MAKIITVLAVVPGAGATITATNIAAWLAALGAKTLLIDLSSRGVISSLFLDEASLGKKAAAPGALRQGEGKRLAAEDCWGFI